MRVCAASCSRRGGTHTTWPSARRQASPSRSRWVRSHNRNGNDKWQWRAGAAHPIRRENSVKGSSVRARVQRTRAARRARRSGTGTRRCTPRPRPTSGTADGVLPQMRTRTKCRSPLHAHRTCGWCRVLYGTPARARAPLDSAVERALESARRRYDRHDRLSTDQVEHENPVENIWDKHEATGLVM